MLDRAIKPIIVATTLISSFLSYSNFSIAESARYSCVSKNGQFLTVAKLSNQEQELVNWQQVEPLIDEEDIAKVCLEFSSRLQDFVNNGNLGFISVGTLNNQYFLCVADQFGTCTGNNFGFLLMLKNNIAPEQALRQFFSTSLIEQSEGNSQNLVVNLNQTRATNIDQSSPTEANQTPNQPTQNTTATKPKSSIQYFCLNESGEKPVTVVDTKRGKIELIIWKSEFFESSGYTPQRRCNQVTARFQQHSDAETLRYVSTGTMNGQKVICVAKNDAGDCRSDGLLLTLEPQDNPNQVLRDLFNLRERSEEGGIFRPGEAGELKKVIAWDKFLERKLNQQANTAPPASSSDTSQSTPSDEPHRICEDEFAVDAGLCH